MKNSSIFILIMLGFFAFGQQKQFNIEWNGDKVLETEYSKIIVPGFDQKHFSYDSKNGLLFFSQWDSSGGLVDENSVTLSNVAYETITQSDLKNLSVNLIPETVKFNFYNTNARGKRGYYIQVSPIINDRGAFKKIK